MRDARYDCPSDKGCLTGGQIRIRDRDKPPEVSMAGELAGSHRNGVCTGALGAKRPTRRGQ
jgi:hypothetical protein